MASIEETLKAAECDEYAMCPMCDWQGGWTREYADPVSGDTEYQWIPCPQCGGNGGIPKGDAEAGEKTTDATN